MKIEQLNSTDHNGCARLRLFVDGKEKFSIGCLSEYPEDSTLERDLGFVYEIVPLMRQAYEAGRNGQPFEFVDTDDVEH